MGRLRRYIVVMVAALLTTFYLCGGSMAHSHVIDGELITHSHPFIPISSHSHTAAQLDFISFTCSALFVVAEILFFCVLEQIGHKIIRGEAISSTSNPIFHLASSRAPPVSLIF